ncbi:MAG: hypothetical protein P0Y64_09780 [Candidatus Sphingomonas colombiensis]|nr:hypothetical protein [Sphingomonas sp.]WEK41710.1 MAG: hypothetical protein P0Y64_09780 [Sphingomonas sp.]
MRKLIGLVVGIVVSMVAITLVELLGRALFPPPPGIDMSDAASIARAVAAIPLGTKMMVVVAWFTGAVAGGWAGLAVSRWRIVPWLVAVGILIGAIISFQQIPHPLWMQIGGALLPFVGALLVLRFAAREVKPIA